MLETAECASDIVECMRFASEADGKMFVPRMSGTGDDGCPICEFNVPLHCGQRTVDGTNKGMYAGAGKRITATLSADGRRLRIGYTWSHG